jgi:hypothetical protein
MKPMNIVIRLKGGHMLRIPAAPIATQVEQMMTIGLSAGDVFTVFNKLPKELRTAQIIFEIVRAVQVQMHKVYEQEKAVSFDYNEQNLLIEAKAIAQIIIFGSGTLLLKAMQKDLDIDLVSQNERFDDLRGAYFVNGPEDLGPEEIDNLILQAVMEIADNAVKHS